MQNRATISLIYEMLAQIALETYKLKKRKGAGAERSRKLLGDLRV